MSVQATFAAALVDEWAHGGVTDAVICPGSRSTPLAVALASRLRVHVRLDERSAGFFALGLSMASGRPTVVCTTSGTAAAELHAAVAEAHHARVPLIVCTADRPPELHDVGASQTIDQRGLFTTSTRWTSAPGVPEASQQQTWRPLAARALAESLHGPHGPGPVHLNLAFREPLVGDPGDLPARHGPTVAPRTTSAPARTESLSGRGLIVAGEHATADPGALIHLAEELSWPVLADPRSGCRVPGTIVAADAIVRSAAVERPETVVLLGSPWLSKAVGEYIATAAAEGARVVSVDPWWQWVDPAHVLSEIHHADPDDWITAALPGAVACDPKWLATWRAHEEAAQHAMEGVLGHQLSEPAARRLARVAGETGATIMVAASMPMRDLEWFAPALPEPPRVMANRGVNGIDGVVSTALGIAAAGRRTYALLGDLAFLHDVSGLVNLPELPCTFVVIDNGGGGIFSFLPQAAALAPERFELLFGTPPTSDVGTVARGFGLPVVDVASISELDRALEQPPPVMVRVRVPGRAENVALHDALNQAVRRAIG